jgi:hypothetical protein
MKEPVRLMYPFAPLPEAMLYDWRLNRCALAIWCYLYVCGMRNRPPDDDMMLMIAGLPPYGSSGTEDEWKPASRRHLELLLRQLEKAGYLVWHRREQMHERFTVLLPAHGDSHDAHGDSHDAHGHAQVAHGDSHHPSIDHENLDHDDDEGGAQNLRFNNQGAELLELGFSRTVALEFQKLPAHQFEKIVARARQVGRQHNGATVAWARARLRQGWPEGRDSDEEDRQGRHASGRRGREPRQDLDDIPDEWK